MDTCLAGPCLSSGCTFAALVCGSLDGTVYLPVAMPPYIFAHCTRASSLLHRIPIPNVYFSILCPFSTFFLPSPSSAWFVVYVVAPLTRTVPAPPRYKYRTLGYSAARRSYVNATAQKKKNTCERGQSTHCTINCSLNFFRRCPILQFYLVAFLYCPAVPLRAWTVLLDGSQVLGPDQL